MDRNDVGPRLRVAQRSVTGASSAMRNAWRSGCALWVWRSTGKAFPSPLHEAALDEPMKWRKPRLVFVNSMSDLFHKSVPTNVYRGRIRDHEPGAPTYLSGAYQASEPRLATQCSAALDTEYLALAQASNPNAGCGGWRGSRKLAPERSFCRSNLYSGHLSHLTLQGINWVIVGGESGPGARPMEADWVRGIRDNCVQNSVPFFFQTMGRRVQETSRPPAGW